MEIGKIWEKWESLEIWEKLRIGNYMETMEKYEMVKFNF